MSEHWLPSGGTEDILYPGSRKKGMHICNLFTNNKPTESICFFLSPYPAVLNNFSNKFSLLLKQVISLSPYPTLVMPFHQKLKSGDFLGGPVVKIQSFHCRGHRFNPRLGD